MLKVTPDREERAARAPCHHLGASVMPAMSAADHAKQPLPAAFAARTRETIANASRILTALALCLLAFSTWAAPCAARTVADLSVLPGFAGGSQPQALLAFNGDLYAATLTATTLGGVGALLKYDPATGKAVSLGSLPGFSGPNLVALNGVIYGTTSEGGGDNGAGSIFSFDPASGKLKSLFSFPAATGNNTVSLIAYNGILYGAVQALTQPYGYIFSFDPAAGAEQVVYTFSGAASGTGPTGFVAVGNSLLGTTAGGQFMAGSPGTIFRFDPSTGDLATLYTFGAGTDGKYPVGSPIVVDGVLYGATSAGGTSGDGTVYAFDLQSNAETVLHSFSSTDGAKPQASLVSLGGLLYGVARAGGAVGNGGVFTVDPATGSESLLNAFAFDGGIVPTALASLNGQLYGTLANGGFRIDGAILNVDPSTGEEKTIYSFRGSIGASVSSLLPSSNGIWGFDSTGLYGCGAILHVLPKRSTATVVYSFSGSDGCVPTGNFVESGGIFYGTTAQGGDDGLGTVFSYNPATNALTTLHSFAGGTDGSSPYSGLTQAGDFLFGVSVGSHGKAMTLFKVALASGKFAPLNDSSQQTFSPGYPLTYTNGALYMSSLFGGPNNNGAIVRFDPVSGVASAAYAFSDRNVASNPQGELIVGDGLLIGTSNIYPAGKVFAFDPVSGAFSVLHTFHHDRAPFVFGANTNHVFGVTLSSTDSIIFRTNPTTGATGQIYDFGSAYTSVVFEDHNRFYGYQFLPGSLLDIQLISLIP